jgi:hypothetical protein
MRQLRFGIHHLSLILAFAALGGALWFSATEPTFQPAAAVSVAPAPLHVSQEVPTTATVAPQKVVEMPVEVAPTEQQTAVDAEADFMQVDDSTLPAAQLIGVVDEPPNSVHEGEDPVISSEDPVPPGYTWTPPDPTAELPLDPEMLALPEVEVDLPIE